MNKDKLELIGVVAPPMLNGEVVFEAPWQSRTFAMARALCERHFYEWNEFRERLIDEIDKVKPGSDFCYFDYFLAALVRLLTEKCLCEIYDLISLEKIYEDRPRGHDHDH